MDSSYRISEDSVVFEDLKAAIQKRGSSTLSGVYSVAFDALTDLGIGALQKYSFMFRLPVGDESQRCIFYYQNGDVAFAVMRREATNKAA